ncbi:hypothetical protein D9758_011517 [Tetrapyrgos nigripes]|uniref:GST N-terminal domain-containing protein n=1 Tax=Tetrapyrgos nigripes TaxID=182062 RepID=A0A8H5CQV9_9AGAR|nr:hypothetical protein D9758_011517 [Tetrapyrgos nigripes]
MGCHGLPIPGKSGKYILLIPFAADTYDTEARSYALNYKRIPYKVVWVEYPDIEGEMKKLGIQPTDTYPDGSPGPCYTLPAVYDPTTKRGISDSVLVARYLDDTYPDRPMLFPPGTRTLQAPWSDVLTWPFVAPMLQFMMPATTWFVNPPSEKFLRARNPIPMEEVYPSGEKKVVEWQKVEKGFAKMEKWFEKEDTFICGKTVTFADFALGAYLMWTKCVLGPDSEEWKDITSWNNGRWGKFLQSLEKYEKF